MRYLLHDVFLDSLGNFSDKTAIIHENGKSFTYRNLKEQSDYYATMLLETEQDKRSFIGVLGPVNFNSIAFVLAVLRIGCAYVPLDDSSPPDRLARVIDNANIRCVGSFSLQAKKFSELLNRYQGCQLILLDENTNLAELFPNALSLESAPHIPPQEPPLLNQVSDDLAYILHTSGSTGVPKGIMLTHRNARTFIDWMHKEFSIHSSDIVMSRAPFKFDLSVFDIFNTLRAGASLVCFDWNKEYREEEKKHSDYVDLMIKHNASVLYTTPSTLITLLNKGGLERVNTLRTIMYAGEPYPVAQLRRLRDKLPDTKIANIYGPTETNIITCFWIDELPQESDAVPLGFPVDDTEIIIVSEDTLKICNHDEVGEIWCRGGTVTLGYLGMEEKTNQCRVRSPFHPYPTYYWRTGDFGRRDRTGVLHYHGRRDHMVKVRGYRIELGELESALSKISGIDMAVVVAVPYAIHGNQLICYYSEIDRDKIEPAQVRELLGKHVPEYMLPDAIERLVSLPTTSSGKVDREALKQKALADHQRQ